MFLPHVCESVFSPSQSSPSPRGAGLVHVLVLALVPFSCKQSVGQLNDHGPQPPQPPSTTRYKDKQSVGQLNDHGPQPPQPPSTTRYKDKQSVGQLNDHGPQPPQPPSTARYKLHSLRTITKLKSYNRMFLSFHHYSCMFTRSGGPVCTW